MSLNRLFRPTHPVPAELRSNFRHLYGDIAWFGVLAASTQAFVGVYAARLGATAFHIGLLTAGPAVVNLAVTLPAGRWLQKRPINRAVFWSAVLTRVFYLLWVPLPLLLAPQGQVQALIGLTLLLSIPGTALAIGFNALFADAVPPEWRGQVVGVRNALLSVTYVAVSLLCGQILVRLPFPMGYLVVFALGFLGGAMSTLHLWFIVPRSAGVPPQRLGRGLSDLARPAFFRSLAAGVRRGMGLRFLLRRGKLRLPNMEVLRGSYGKLMAVMFTFNLTLYLAIPLFPLHWVNQLHLSDGDIGLGNALFYVSAFVGSTQLARLVRRHGNQRVTALGAMLVCAYPSLMSLSRGLELFLVASVLGGLGFSMIQGALINYVLEKIPADNRPPYLAWYNMALNGALLLGSLMGPFIAGFIGVRTALAVFAGLRFVSALIILRWE